MPTVTKTIGSVGRDYATLTAAENAITNTTFPDPDTDVVFEIYNDSVYDESLIINWTATNVNSVTFTVPESERHNGTPGTGARIVASGTIRRILIQTSNSYVEWLEINHGGLGILGSSNALTADNTAFRNMIIHNANAGGVDNVILVLATESCDIINNLVFNLTNGGGLGNDGIRTTLESGDTINICNNTVYNCYGHGIDTDLDSATITVRNNVVTNTVTGNDFDLAGTVNTVCSNNASEDESAPGANSITGISATNQYVSAGSDFHLKAGSALIDMGFDLGTSPSGVNIDIDGHDRDAEGDIWDIGANEFDEESSSSSSVTSSSSSSFSSSSSVTSSSSSVTSSSSSSSSSNTSSSSSSSSNSSSSSSVTSSSSSSSSFPHILGETWVLQDR